MLGVVSDTEHSTAAAVPATTDPSDKLNRLVAAQLTKTKMCAMFRRGACRDAKCRFAHSQTELRSAPDLWKTAMCRAFGRGGCKDPKCKFAHGEEELRVTKCVYKTQLCNFNERGRCKKGSQCRHAHGVAELRQFQGASEPPAQQEQKQQKLQSSPTPSSTSTAASSSSPVSVKTSNPGGPTAASATPERATRSSSRGGRGNRRGAVGNGTAASQVSRPLVPAVQVSDMFWAPQSAIPALAKSPATKASSAALLTPMKVTQESRTRIRVDSPMKVIIPGFSDDSLGSATTSANSTPPAPPPGIAFFEAAAAMAASTPVQHRFGNQAGGWPETSPEVLKAAFECAAAVRHAEAAAMHLATARLAGAYADASLSSQVAPAAFLNMHGYLAAPPVPVAKALSAVPPPMPTFKKTAKPFSYEVVDVATPELRPPTGPKWVI